MLEITEKARQEIDKRLAKRPGKMLRLIAEGFG